MPNLKEPLRVRLTPPALKLIRISDEVDEKLKELAAELNLPFSTPNDVIRRVLGLPPREVIPWTPRGRDIKPRTRRFRRKP